MLIDQVLVRIAGGHNLISLRDWEQMTVEARLGIINEDRVQFLSEGSPVSVREALLRIKAARQRN